MTKAKVIPLKPPLTEYQDLGPEDLDQLILGLFVIFKTVAKRSKAMELGRLWFASQGAKVIQDPDFKLRTPDVVNDLRRQKRKGQYVLTWRNADGYKCFNTLAEAAEYLDLSLYQLRQDFSGKNEVHVTDGLDEANNPDPATLTLVPFEELTDFFAAVEAHDRRQ